MNEKAIILKDKIKLLETEINLLKTKIRKLELDKKKLYSIIRHFAFENNVNNNFIRELVKIYNEDLKI